MQFAYSDLKAEMIGGLRFYGTTDGRKYPSVTTVLGRTMPKEKMESLQAWRDALGPEADMISRAAADRGTAVHAVIERYLKNQPLCISGEAEWPEGTMTLFNALKTKLNKIKPVVGLEVALYSNALEIAGRCDCIGVFNDKLSIVDFKTSSRVKNDGDIYDYKLQLTAYALMHNEMFGTDINTGVILMTSGSGFPQQFTVDLLEYVNPLCDRVEAFYDNPQL